MAQQRLRDYQEPLTSFEHNIFNFGLHGPGRYMGFDVIETTGVSTFILKHTGLQFKDPGGNTRGPIGVALTPQGTIVMEDDFLPGFASDSNSGNNYVRWDALVLNHVYSGVAGGTPATYSIVKGPMGAAVKPSLPSPFYQVVIGWIRWDANQAALNANSWVKASSPDSGDGKDARIFDENGFKMLNMFHQSNTVLSAPKDVNTGKWDFKNDGNIFKIIIPDDGFGQRSLRLLKIEDAALQNGTTIDIFIDGFMIIEELPSVAPQDFNEGYRRIIVPHKYRNGPNNLGLPGYSTQVGYHEIVTLKQIDQVWYLVNTLRVTEAPVETETESGYGRILFGQQRYIGDPGGSDSKFTINFPTPLPSDIGGNYYVVGTLVSQAGGSDGWNKDNDVFFMIKNKTHTGFELLCREISGAVQALNFEYVIIVF